MPSTPANKPMQFAGCYSLHLYCDRVNEAHPWDGFPREFTGETFGECAKQARQRGWKIHLQTRTATCPLCAKEGR